MGLTISIDPITRIIDILKMPVDGVLDVTVARNIYSEAKEDWLTTPALRKLRFPLRDPITAIIKGVQVGPFVFVDNESGWRFRATDADQEMTLIGDLVALNEDIPLFEARPGRKLVVFGFLSAKTQTALGVAAPPWTANEAANIRYVLGVDGTKVQGSKPALVDDILDEDLSIHNGVGTTGEAIAVAALKAALASVLARETLLHVDGSYPVGFDEGTSELIQYELDGTTERRRIQVYDKNGGALVFPVGVQAKRGVPTVPTP